MVRLYRSFPRRSAVAVAIALASFTGACKEATKETPVQSIVGLPATDSVTVGGSKQFTVNLLDNLGNVIPDRTASWSSSNNAVATVSSTGTVTGVTTSAATITASAGGKIASMNLIVQPAVAAVVLAPTDFTLQIGQTRQLTATITDAGGRAIAGRRVDFSSSDPAIATVNSSGVVAAVAPGTATLRAQSEGKTADSRVTVVQVAVASITISPAGSQTIQMNATLQLTATTRDANGQVLTGRTIAWTTGNAQVATVSAAGVVTPVSLGTTSITAQSEAAVQSAQVTIVPQAPASVGVTPPSATMLVGVQQQFSVIPKDGQGNALPLAGRSIGWSSSNIPVASVSGTGVVLAQSAGNATITATVDGVSGTSAVTVSVVPVVTMTIDPTSLTIKAGTAPAQLTATPRDNVGNPLSGRIITWKSSDSTKVTVTSPGPITTVGALAIGTITVTATCEGIAVPVMVFVTP
jgi:uncharacterized protein YjdB